MVEDTEAVVAKFSNIESMLCACNSYLKTFRDRNSEALIDIKELLLTR